MSTSAVLFDNAGTIALILGTVLPVLVGFVTKMSTHPGIRAVLLLGASALTSVLKAAYDAGVNHVAWDWKPVVYSAVIVFITGVGVQFGFWKPTGVSDFAKGKLIVDSTSEVVADEPMPVQMKRDFTLAIQPLSDAEKEEARRREAFLAASAVQAATPLVDMLPDDRPVQAEVTSPIAVVTDEPLPLPVEESSPIGDAVEAAIKKRAPRKAPAKKLPAKKAPVKRAPRKTTSE